MEVKKGIVHRTGDETKGTSPRTGPKDGIAHVTGDEYKTKALASAAAEPKTKK